MARLSAEPIALNQVLMNLVIRLYTEKMIVLPYEEFRGVSLFSLGRCLYFFLCVIDAIPLI